MRFMELWGIGVPFFNYLGVVSVQHPRGNLMASHVDRIVRILLNCRRG